MEESAVTNIKGPCREACPAGVDVPRYIRFIKEGNFDQALAVIHESIPFPAVCGYACAHPCESKCARRQYDDPVAIRLLKRVAVEKGGDVWKDKIKIAPLTGKKVAIIGAGPCGLTAAYYLAGKGHTVTVFEALPLPGGMMRYGIPEYRLPNNVVSREIEIIKERGVTIKTGVRVESAERLLLSGFDVILATSGAWRGVKTDLAETPSARVLDGVSFLKDVNTGNLPAIGNRVVVVGGGNTAIDAARSSVRLGAREVMLLYRRTMTEMPASPEEIREALDEGVNIQFLAAPVKIMDSKAQCVKMALGPSDRSGRPQPVPVEGGEFSIFFDTLIMAVGQSADAASLGLEGNSNGTVKVDPDTLATGKKAVFAAGDAVTGPSSIIQAIAQGKHAAASIDKYLGGDGMLAEKLSDEKPAEIQEPSPRGTARACARSINVLSRKNCFNLVELGFAEKVAVAEAQRCMSCDFRNYSVSVQSSICKECGYCREVCSLGIFELSGSFNPFGYKSMIASHTEKCVGCLKCLMVCPDFAISVQDASGI